MEVVIIIKSQGLWLTSSCLRLSTTYKPLFNYTDKAEN